MLPPLLMTDDSSTLETERLAIREVRHRQLLRTSCEIMDPCQKPQKESKPRPCYMLRGLPALSSSVYFSTAEHCYLLIYAYITVVLF